MLCEELHLSEAEQTAAGSAIVNYIQKEKTHVIKVIFPHYIRAVCNMGQSKLSHNSTQPKVFSSILVIALTTPQVA